MPRDVTACVVSLLLHMALLATAVACAGGAPVYTKPVLIDFTSENVNESCQELDALRSGGAPANPLPQPPRQQTGKPRAAAVGPVLQEVPPALPSAVEQSAEAVPVAAAPSEVPPPQVAAVTHNAPPVSTGSRGSGSGIAGSGSGASAGGGDAASGHGGRGTSEETLRQRYLKRHFAYIRDRVASNMRYPGMAQRMGWSGNLAIEFVVALDGSAERIRVVKSSGVPLLDSDARDTVLRSAPFPKPPVSARLVIPVAYHLEN